MFFVPTYRSNRFRIPGRWGHNALGVFMAMVVVVSQNSFTGLSALAFLLPLRTAFSLAFVVGVDRLLSLLSFQVLRMLFL